MVKGDVLGVRWKVSALSFIHFFVPLLLVVFGFFVWLLLCLFFMLCISFLIVVVRMFGLLSGIWLSLWLGFLLVQFLGIW